MSIELDGETRRCIDCNETCPYQHLGEMTPIEYDGKMASQEKNRVQ
jgi:hypothetical protein